MNKCKLKSLKSNQMLFGCSLTFNRLLGKKKNYCFSLNNFKCAQSISQIEGIGRFSICGHAFPEFKSSMAECGYHAMTQSAGVPGKLWSKWFGSEGTLKIT